jgi:hypothetical protein
LGVELRDGQRCCDARRVKRPCTSTEARRVGLERSYCLLAQVSALASVAEKLTFTAFD